MTEKTLFHSNITFEEAKKLIKNGADVNEESSGGKTPLFYVNDLDIARLLIQHGADLNHANDTGHTPLFYAQNVDVAQLFIDNGADINAKTQDQLTLLFYVSDINLIDLYTKNSIDVNVIDRLGRIVLYTGDKLTNKDKVALLIKAGSNLNTQSDKGTALSVLKRYRNIDPVIPKLLIDNGAIASEIDDYLKYRNLFTIEQQKAFDIFASITHNNEDFFHMCLAYQEGMKNLDQVEIKEMDIL